MKTISIFLGMLVLLTGCTTVPESIIQQPMTAKPQPLSSAQPNNGAIYQANAYRPLFEDKRARLIGDVITIVISEKTSAGKAASSSASNSGSINSSIPSIVGLPFKTLQGMSVGASSSGKNADTDALTATNNFTSTLTVTVVDVLANGNLVVSGEKQVSLDKGVEYVRFSGVVSPDTIEAGNIVSSTNVADAKIEYRTNSRIDKAAVMAMMTRFFLNVLPF
ncbi:MAG: flagellar basal body L-ring protein FlgH [Sulfuriferula sp.]|nr:flagellar basal body L-ring protein FlgH [Sulfuriferula sp.]